MIVALANLSAWVWWPTRLHGPHVGQDAGLVIEREVLQIECTGPSHPCTLEARYTVRNPQAQEAKVTAALFARYARTREIRIDGVLNGRELEETEWKRLVDQAQQVMPGWPWPGQKKCKECPIPPGRTGFDLALAPGASAHVVVSGYLDESDRPGELVYELAPIRTWGQVRQVEVIVRAPQPMKVSTFERFDPTNRPEIVPASCTTTGPLTRCSIVDEGSAVPTWLHVELQP